MKISGFSWLPVLVFLVAAVFFYLKPLFKTIDFAVPFLIFLTASFLFLRIVPERYWLPAVLFLGILFYFFLGVKNLVFIHRERAYLIFNLAVIYLLLIVFFADPKEPFYLLKLIALFFAVSYLFGESIKFRRPLYNIPMAFILIQSVWAISLLPIGFFQSANLAWLVGFTINDLARAHLKKTLSLKGGLQKSVVFVLLSALILITSKWTL
jgi:hypothetical protein